MKRVVIAIGLFVATLVAGACAQLLGIRDPAPRPFEHRAHTIEGIACNDCHQGMDRAGELGPLHVPGTETCISCHEDPHDPSPCGRCHGQPLARAQAEAARSHILFRHDQHLEETDGQCIPCHAGASHVGEDASAPMGVCLSCHAHEDQIRIRDCEACHADLREEMPVPETHVVHGPDVLRTHAMQAASAGELCTTCHTERFCADCHGVTVAALPSRLRFDEPFRASMHRAGFMARHALEARGDPAVCTTCHSEPFCNECHLERRVSGIAEMARNPHPPGWVGALASQNLHGPAARRDPASCASCHGGAGEMLCVGCHRVGGVGGNPHPPGFDSRKSLSELPCRLCHSPMP